MNDSTLKIIAVLLALILAVELNGADAVKANLGSAAFVVVAIGAVALGIRLLWYMITSVSDAIDVDLRLTKARGDAWRWKYLFYLALAGLVSVAGWAFMAAGFTFKNPYYSDALAGIPYSSALVSLTVVLFVFAFIFFIFESAPKWWRGLPKVPGAALALLETLGRMFAAPYREPATRWREIKAKRLSGVELGSIRAASSIVTSFLGGCFVFLIGTFILVAVMGNLLWVLGPTISGAP